MSRKRIRTHCLVVDASVARAAGKLEAQHPTGIVCRDFLMTVRGVCHRIAWNQSIKAEWDRHRSGFAADWLVSMMNLKKLRPVRDDPLEELRAAIENCSGEASIATIMRKDAHLIESALATDFRVASLDDVARGHFARLVCSFHQLRRVIWVNPGSQEQGAVEWLELGAPAERSRRLSS